MNYFLSNSILFDSLGLFAQVLGTLLPVASKYLPFQKLTHVNLHRSEKKGFVSKMMHYSDQHLFFEFKIAHKKVETLYLLRSECCRTYFQSPATKRESQKIKPNYGILSKVSINRLVLITYYLLDNQLALYSLLLLWGVKFNKPWNNFFTIKILSYVHDIIQPFANV